MLAVATRTSKALQHIARLTGDHDDFDEAPTLERTIVLGDPCIVSHTLPPRDAALTALMELAAADAERDDDPITQKFLVPDYSLEDFDPSLIDALLALEEESESIEVVLDFSDDPTIEAHELPPSHARIIERLVEPYVDFRSLAHLV